MSVNVSLKTVDGAGNPQRNAAVFAVTPGAGTSVPTSFFASGNTFEGGQVLITGLSAGVYDLLVIGTGSTATLPNYEVKNAYVVPDVSSQNYESRLVIQSQVGVTDGILTQDKTVKVADGTSNGIKTNEFGLAWPIVSGNDIHTTISIDSLYTENSGNSYYHSNTSATQIQRARLQF